MVFRDLYLRWHEILSHALTSLAQGKSGILLLDIFVLYAVATCSDMHAKKIYGLEQYVRVDENQHQPLPIV